MTVSLVVACAENGVIGRDNALPWHLPNDLKRFKQLTTGHTIVMGRKTYDAIGRPLPNRRSVVISRDRGFVSPGIEVAPSLSAALAAVANGQELFVVGGQEIFQLALPLADRIYLTRVHAEPPGDAYFPALVEHEWELVSSEPYAADDRHQYAYSFELYQRRSMTP